jgi:hypothetical protein
LSLTSRIFVVPLLVAVFALPGCALARLNPFRDGNGRGKPARPALGTRHKPHGGNLTTNIVSDAAERMALVWPPAKVRLNLVRRPDDFGKLLVHRLREDGYAVFENVAAGESYNRHPADRMLAARLNGEPDYQPPPRGGADFSYDVFGGDGEALLVIKVGGEMLSRAYARDDGEGGVYVPAGDWARGGFGPREGD